MKRRNSKPLQGAETPLALVVVYVLHCTFYMVGVKRQGSSQLWQAFAHFKPAFSALNA